MSTPEWKNYSDETGGAARAAHGLPDSVYFALLAVSVLVAIPPALNPKDEPLLLLGVLSVAVAAFAAAGLALKARPRRYVKSWRDLAWDGEVARLPGFSYTSSDDGVWLITTRQHRKGHFPSVRILMRDSDQGHWEEVVTDIAINRDGDVTLSFGLARAKEDDGPKLMVVIA